MKELRIAIIGTGAISNRHMKVWSQIPGTKVVAAAEIDSARRKAWGERYGFEEKDLYADFREMLKRDDIDAVDVCVHNNLHTPVAIAVMKAGYPCYSEKPMAGSYADAKLMYDASKQLGVKLAIQISSIYNLQTRWAKQMVADGTLGKVYHARSIGHRRVGRPGVDMPLSPDFISKEIGGHGPMFDLGVYHLSQMLYILGMPKLESVYGAAYNGYFLDERLLKGRKYEVEDLGVGIARFEGGLTMDILEDWALNMDEVGTSFVAGELGGLKILNSDTYGGPLAMSGGGMGGGGFGKMDPPELEFHGYENGMMVVKQLNCSGNSRTEVNLNPQIALYNDNQVHWAAYLRGDLTDETRIDSPYIAMQTALLSEGIFISDALRRSVTAEEIMERSVSTAVRHQKTEWGVIDYDF